MDVMCCDVCGDDGSSMRQSLNHHANPHEPLNHTKRARHSFLCKAYIGIRGSESAKFVLT